MKHWDGRDRDNVVPLRLPRRDRTPLRPIAQTTVRRQQRPHVGSWIGLTLALVVLVGIALATASSDPVSSKLLP
jgi:hypothetical protein